MPYYRCPGCGLTVHTAAAFSTARVCPDCSEALPEDARVFPSATSTRQIRRVLAARPEAAAKARHAVRVLPVPLPTRDTLELLVSELVTNAVLHAGLSAEDPISVHITSRADRVRVAVRDPGPGFAGTPEGNGDLLAPGGRGVTIVEALSDAWGIDLDSAGCTVWCELSVDESAGEAMDRAVTDAYIKQLVSGAGPQAATTPSG
jgi:anti-sigma regulatory factor (Ser/Thr protein kinase)